jgi:hypothetical protein
MPSHAYLPLLLAAAATAQTPQLTLGWIGQSNMQGICNRATMATQVMPSDAALSAAVRYYQVDLNSYSDSAGVLSPMGFSGWPLAAARTGGFDYQPNLLPSLLGRGRNSFGPDLNAAYLLSQAAGQQVLNVKLALGETFLTTQPASASAAFVLAGAYLWRSSFDSFDPNAARAGENDAFHATTVARGTVTSATSAASGAATLTDAEQEWTPGQWIGHWAVSGRCQGLVLSNTATTLNLLTWAPTFESAPSPQATYGIQARTRRPASLARSFVEGYCAKASALLALEGKSMDLRVVGVQIGESDAATLANASQVQARMTALIAWLRAELHGRGFTTVAQDEIGFVLGLIKDDGTYPYAPMVNAAYVNIAAIDDFVETSPVAGLAVGGRFPDPADPNFDPYHYTADAQMINGANFASRIQSLINDQ